MSKAPFEFEKNTLLALCREREWADPKLLPVGKPPVKPFDPQMLPETFAPWIEDIAERLCCPMDFPAVGAMVALSSVVGRKCGIRPKQHDDWLVIPNLWGAVIGRPGVMKTPALSEALKPLDRLVMEAKEAHREAVKEAEMAEKFTAVKRKAVSQNLKKAYTRGDAAASKALEEELAALEPKEIPLERRYKTNDCTVEKLGELLNQNPNGLLVFRDELTGWLRMLDKDGRENDRAFYLEAWAGGGSYDYDRIGRGNIYIEAACVSVLGGIQPGPLSEYVRDANKGAQGADGLLQRFQLLVYPNDIYEWRNVDRWPDLAAKNAAYDVFKRLAGFDPTERGARVDEYGGKRSIPYFRFSEEAQAEFNDWWHYLETKKLRQDEPEIIEAHLSKYKSLVTSLALLIHLAEGWLKEVSIGSLKKAIEWTEYLETHARRVFADALAPEVAAAVALAHKIKAGELQDGFTAREVHRKHWQSLDKEGTYKAVEYLEDLDWLRVERQDTGGRPSLICRVNPKLRRPL